MTAEQEAVDLLEDLPRGRGRDHIGTPPHSYFESTQNLAATESLRFDAANPEAKLFLGVVGGRVVSGNRLPDGRTTRHVARGIPIGLADDRHHFLLAGTRGDKGRAFLVGNMLLMPATTSLLCLDPKGSLARSSVRYRAESLKQQVVVIDPFDVSGPTTRRYRGAFNAIETLRKSDRRTFVPNAKSIADSLVIPGNQKDPHWDDTARQAIAMLAAHVATHERYEGVRDLVTVWQLATELTTPDPHNSQRYWLEQELFESDAAGGYIRSCSRAFYGRAGSEFSSVTSNTRKMLDFLGIECMRDCLTGPGVDLRDLKRRSMAVYVTLPAMRMTDLSGWLRLIVQQTLAAHEEETEQLGGPTIAFLDECHVLQRMQALETAAAQFAGLMRIVAVYQDLSQVQSRYPGS